MQRLTQGQPAAEMTPLSAPQASSEAESGNAAAGPSAAAAQPTHSTTGASGPVDARAIADRVYEMLRADLRIFNKRSGIG